MTLFDSLFTGKLNSSLELQLCQLYRPLIDSNGLLVFIALMQQQTSGTLHCGPFCIAAAYYTAIGDEIGSLVFEASKLRPHIAKCFEQERFLVFHWLLNEKYQELNNRTTSLKSTVHENVLTHLKIW